MGFINDTSSSSGAGERGERGIAGRGISSITSVDNNDGSIELTFTYNDGSEPDIFVNTLVSDALIQLDKLTLEGTNMFEKFSISSSDETRVLTVNTTTKSVNLLNPLTASAPTIGNSIVNKTYADTIQTLATDAKTIAENTQGTAETAQDTANTAITNASMAQTSANTAQSTANAAQISANTAQYAADAAQVDADAGIAVATSAYNTANTAIGYLNQNVKTTSTPAFVGVQFPSSQTTPSLVSGKLVLSTNDGGDLIGILPTGITFPIGGATMPFKRLFDSVTSVIYTEPSANLFSIIWDSASLSVGISFPAATYYGSTTVCVASSLIRLATNVSDANPTTAGLITIVAGSTFFLLTRTTTAPTGINTMSSAGMHFWAEVFTRTGGDANGPYPVFRIEIRKGVADGSSFNVKWLY